MQSGDLSAVRLLIVGDVMLDRYWFGDVSRISPEAPVPVVKVERSEERPGGAANVARNAAALGAKVSLLALVGNDAGWTQIAREQVKMLHDDVATVLARTDYHAVVAGFGAEGLVVKTMAEVPAALARARELAHSGKPVLVNVWLDKTEFREGSLSM